MGPVDPEAGPVGEPAPRVLLPSPGLEDLPLILVSAGASRVVSFMTELLVDEKPPHLLDAKSLGVA